MPIDYDSRSLRYFGSAQEGELPWLEELQAFHLCVSPVDALQPDRIERWRAMLSPHLRDHAALDVQAEAALGLLGCWEGAGTAVDDAEGDAAQLALARAVLATMPPLPRWLRYIEDFPAGEPQDDLRRERRETILRCVPHLHPDPAALAGDEPLPALLSAGIQAHVEGPYNCLACRRRKPRSPATVSPMRLAASTGATGGLQRHETSVVVRGARRRLEVGFLSDAGFLRVFPAWIDESPSHRITMRVTVFFRGNQRKEGTVAYPDDGMTGANLGSLQGARVEDITGFALGA